MQGLQHATEHGIRVGKFRMARDPEVRCAPMATIETPTGEPFSSYVRDALVSELSVAGVYSESAPVTLTGVVQNVEPLASSQGEWRIVLDVMSSNGISVQIDARHAFTRARGDSLCALAAEELMPAVQELVAKLVNDQRFKALVAG
jgi:hypothetical protein